MISLRAVLFVILCFGLMAGCASKNEGHSHAHSSGDEWREMDDYHMIMAEAYHPYKDSANLEPAKSRASELMTAASAWASSALPEKVDNGEMRSKLDELKAEAVAFAESVKTADDNVIGEQLTKLHDTFHEIQEAWYGGH